MCDTALFQKSKQASSHASTSGTAEQDTKASEHAFRMTSLRAPMALPPRVATFPSAKKGEVKHRANARGTVSI